MRQAIFFYLLLASTCCLAQGRHAGSDPRIHFGMVQDTNTTCAQILSSPKLIVTPPDYKIVHFQIFFKTRGGEIYGPFSHKNPYLTNDEIAIAKRLVGKHVTIFFEDIKVLTPDNMTRAMGGLNLHYDR